MFLQACQLLTAASPAVCKATGPRAALSPSPKTGFSGSDEGLDHTPSSTSREEVASRSLQPNPDLFCPPLHPQPPNSPRDLKDRQPHRQGQDDTRPHAMDKFDDIVQVHCEPSCPPLISHDCHVKGRLRDGLKFWSEIGAHDMIKSVLANGYFIPFVQIPPPMFFSNNTSALRHHEFVTESVVELLSSGRIQETPLPSYIVSPLSVSCQNETKKRLILDLSVLNKFVRTQHFKLDDSKTGLQYFSPNALLFAFDLKSGYHHIEIAPQHQNTWAFHGSSIMHKGFLNLPFYPLAFLQPLISLPKC